MSPVHCLLLAVLPALRGEDADPSWKTFYSKDPLNVASVEHFATAIASSKFRRRKLHGPGSLIDNDPETWWNAGDPGGQWIEVRWKYPRYIRRVAFAKRTSKSVRSFRILGHMGGTQSDQWQELASGNSEDGGPILSADFDLTPLKAVRIELVPLSKNSVLDVADLKAYTDEEHLPVYVQLAESKNPESVRMSNLDFPSTVQPGTWVDVTAEFVCKKKLARDYDFFLQAGLPNLLPSDDYLLVESFVRPAATTSQWKKGKSYAVSFKTWIPEYAPPGEELEVTVNGSSKSARLEVKSGTSKKLKIAERLHASPSPAAQDGSLRLVRNGEQTIIRIGEETLSGRQAVVSTRSFENLYNLSECDYRIFVVGTYPHYLIDLRRNESRNIGICSRIIDRQCRLLQKYSPGSRFIISLIYRGTPEFIRRNQKECVKLPDGRVLRPSPASLQFRKACLRVTKKLIDKMADRPWRNRVIGYELLGFEDGTFRWWGYNRGKWEGRDNLLIPVDVSKPALREFRRWLKAKYGMIETLLKAWGNEKATFTYKSAVPDTEAMRRHYGSAFRDPLRSRAAVDYFDFRHDTVFAFRKELAELARQRHGGKVIVQTHSSYPNFGIFTQCPTLIGSSEQQRLCSDAAFDSLGQNHSYVFRRRDNHYAFQTIYSSLQRHNKIAWSELDNRTWLSHLADYKEYSLKGSVERERMNFGANLCLGMVERRLTFNYGRSGQNSEMWLGSPALKRELRSFAALEKFALGAPWKTDKEIAVFVSYRSSNYMDALTPMPWFNQVFQLLQKELHFIGAPFDVYHLEDIGDPFVQKQYKLYIFLNAEVMTDEQVSIIEKQYQKDGKTLLWFWAPGYLDETKGFQPERVSRLTGMRLRIDKEPIDGKVIIDGKLASEFGATEFQPQRAYANRKWFESRYGPHFYVDDPTAGIAGRYAHNDKPAFAVQGLAEWTSIFCGVPYLPRRIIQTIAWRAGIHIYFDSTSIAMTACRDWVMVYNPASQWRKIELRLPRPSRVYDVFKKKIATDVVLSMRPFQTKLLYIGERDIGPISEGLDW